MDTGALDRVDRGLCATMGGSELTVLKHRA
jgi:hypothetical protein